MLETQPVPRPRRELHISEPAVGGLELLTPKEAALLAADSAGHFTPAEQAWFDEGDRLIPADVAERMHEPDLVHEAQKWYQRYLTAAEQSLRGLIAILEHKPEQGDQVKHTRVLFERLQRCFADDKAVREAAAKELIDTTVRIHDIEYTLRRKLGKGAYGITFLADAPNHPEPVVLKLSAPYDHMKIHASDDELRDKDDKVATMIARNMILEIASLHRLTRGPGNKPLSSEVALPFSRLFAAQFLRHPDNKTGTESYIAVSVQEYIPGHDLRWYLLNQTDHHLQADPDFIRNVAWQLIDAVQQAHRKGVLHCDLKPSNVMVTPEGLVKPIDWGSSHLPDKTANPKIKWAQASGLFSGTPEFMSMPYDSQPTRARDVYAIGRIILKMIYGYKSKLEPGMIAQTMSSLDPQLQVLTQVAKMMTHPLPEDRISLDEAMTILTTELKEVGWREQIAQTKTALVSNR